LALCATPFWSVAVTTAPGITAPVESFTVPRIVPLAGGEAALSSPAKAKIAKQTARVKRSMIEFNIQSISAL
jgi:hypothetical protein